jgi:hypothetical protein
MSNTLSWPGAKTAKQAAEYQMTRGFVAVELYNETARLRDEASLRNAQLSAEMARLIALNAKLAAALKAVLKFVPLTFDDDDRCDRQDAATEYAQAALREFNAVQQPSPTAAAAGEQG